MFFLCAIEVWTQDNFWHPRLWIHVRLINLIHDGVHRENIRRGTMKNCLNMKHNQEIEIEIESTNFWWDKIVVSLLRSHLSIISTILECYTMLNYLNMVIDFTKPKSQYHGNCFRVERIKLDSSTIGFFYFLFFEFSKVDNQSVGLNVACGSKIVCELSL